MANTDSAYFCIEVPISTRLDKTIPCRKEINIRGGKFSLLKPGKLPYVYAEGSIWFEPPLIGFHVAGGELRLCGCIGNRAAVLPLLPVEKKEGREREI